jgi:hypothetical protein
VLLPYLKVSLLVLVLYSNGSCGYVIPLNYCVKGFNGVVGTLRQKLTALTIWISVLCEKIMPLCSDCEVFPSPRQLPRDFMQVTNCEHCRAAFGCLGSSFGEA